MTTHTVWILPYTPSRLYLGTSLPFTVFFFQDNGTWVYLSPGSPAFYNSFLVKVVTNWSMTWVPICTGTHPHIYDLQQPK